MTGLDWYRDLAIIVFGIAFVLALIVFSVVGLLLFKEVRTIGRHARAASSRVKGLASRGAERKTLSLAANFIHGISEVALATGALIEQRRRQ